MLLSEFGVPRTDFWFAWTYPAIVEVIHLRIERQPATNQKKDDQDIGSKYQLDELFLDP